MYQQLEQGYIVSEMKCFTDTLINQSEFFVKIMIKCNIIDIIKLQRLERGIILENSKIKGLKPLVETDFVSLYDVEYKNKKGQEKHWMVSSRKSKEELEKVYLENNEDKIDAVVICALHKAQNKLVLINQYRVPINKYIYELPAGLVDNNEDIETSVRRELKEETGLDLISINKINSKDKLYLSPGMTDESVAFVYCLCDGEITDKYQEDDEDIKAMLISKEEAKNILENEESIDIKAYLMLQIFEKLGESLFIQLFRKWYKVIRQNEMFQPHVAQTK